MKKISRLLMLVLSYAPIATVAAAAQAKASEIEGEAQALITSEAASAARSRVMPAGQMETTYEAALQFSSSKTGLQGAELETSVRSDLDLLSRAGLVEIDEKRIMAMGPSEHI